MVRVVAVFGTILGVILGVLLFSAITGYILYGDPLRLFRNFAQAIANVLQGR